MQQLRQHQSVFAHQEMANACTVLPLEATLPQWLHERRKAHQYLVVKGACSDRTMQRLTPLKLHPTTLLQLIGMNARAQSCGCTGLQNCTSLVNIKCTTVAEHVNPLGIALAGI